MKPLMAAQGASGTAGNFRRHAGSTLSIVSGTDVSRIGPHNPSIKPDQGKSSPLFLFFSKSSPGAAPEKRITGIPFNALSLNRTSIRQNFPLPTRT